MVIVALLLECWKPSAKSCAVAPDVWLGRRGFKSGMTLTPTLRSCQFTPAHSSRFVVDAARRLEKGHRTRVARAQEATLKVRHLWADCAEPVLGLGTRYRGCCVAPRGAVLEKNPVRAAADNSI